MIHDPVYGELLELTRRQTPWAFARFNDGEMSLIMRTQSTASRGHQQASDSLRGSLMKAMLFSLPRYFVGVPSTRYGRMRKKALEMLGDDHPRMVESWALTHNWRDWSERFPDAVGGRPVIWIVGEGTFIGHEPPIDFSVQRVITVPANNAWEWWKREGNYDFNLSALFPGTVVLLSCGPLARVLTANGFASRPDCTFIDVGTLYDPWTKNIRRKYHRRF